MKRKKVQDEDDEDELQRSVRDGATGFGTGSSEDEDGRMNGEQGSSEDEELGAGIQSDPYFASRDGVLNGGLTELPADYSARRTSARVLADRSGRGLVGDFDGSEDELLAEEILRGGQSDDEDETQYANDLIPEEALADSPTKPKRKSNTPRKPPSPPPDLPPHEEYFYKNRPGASKVSIKPLPANALVSHEEYHEFSKNYKDPNEPGMDFLHALHSQSFDQWLFELQEGFSVCLFGWGSKRELLLDFAQHVSDETQDKVVIVSGYDHALKIRDVLVTIASTVPSLKTSLLKLPAQPADLFSTVKLAFQDTPELSITLIVHSIDGKSLRRAPQQTMLAQLADLPQVRLIASTDTPHFGILWDTTLRSQFNWIFHDTTTFQPFDEEINGGTAGGVVDEVNALLGRSGRKMHGREGVMYVLRSLTQNARNLFALLIAELLSAEDDRPDNAGDGEDEDEDETQQYPSTDKPPQSGVLKATVEWRTLYQKAVAQFIATNEMSFRGLLKEFYDHEMIVSRRDALGTDLLTVPFRREELETLLEELMGGEE